MAFGHRLRARREAAASSATGSAQYAADGSPYSAPYAPGTVPHPAASTVGGAGWWLASTPDYRPTTGEQAAPGGAPDAMPMASVVAYQTDDQYVTLAYQGMPVQFAADGAPLYATAPMTPGAANPVPAGNPHPQSQRAVRSQIAGYSSAAAPVAATRPNGAPFPSGPPYPRTGAGRTQW